MNQAAAASTHNAPLSPAEEMDRPTAPPHTHTTKAQSTPTNTYICDYSPASGFFSPSLADCALRLLLPLAQAAQAAVCTKMGVVVYLPRRGFDPFLGAVRALRDVHACACTHACTHSTHSVLELLNACTFQVESNWSRYFVKSFLWCSDAPTPQPVAFAFATKLATASRGAATLSSGGASYGTAAGFVWAAAALCAPVTCAGRGDHH